MNVAVQPKHGPYIRGTLFKELFKHPMEMGLDLSGVPNGFFQLLVFRQLFIVSEMQQTRKPDPYDLSILTFLRTDCLKLWM